MAEIYETNIRHVSEGHNKDEYVYIESTERIVIHALEQKPDKFEIVHEDNTLGLPRQVKFRIKFDQVNWAALAKRSSGMTNEQKERARAQLAHIRKVKM